MEISRRKHRPPGGLLQKVSRYARMPRSPTAAHGDLGELVAILHLAVLNAMEAKTVPIPGAASPRYSCVVGAVVGSCTIEAAHAIPPRRGTPDNAPSADAAGFQTGQRCWPARGDAGTLQMAVSKVGREVRCAPQPWAPRPGCSLPRLELLNLPRRPDPRLVMPSPPICRVAWGVADQPERVIRAAGAFGHVTCGMRCPTRKTGLHFGYWGPVVGNQ